MKTDPKGSQGFKKKLNKNLPLLNENTKEMEDEPTPIDRFDADPEFRVYCQGQIDYWYKRAKGEGQPPRSFMKLLVDSLYFVNGDYGYFKWLHNKGKPMPTEEDAPVEGWSF